MRLVLVVVGCLVLAGASAAQTAKPAVTLTLKDHRFEPARFSVPAGQKVEITLVNKDASFEEFDSDDLGVEQQVTPHGVVRFDIGPLKPGTYEFMGEHHAKTAQGVVTAK